jgi:polar amino acid transport system substrate-binding protein
MKLKRFNIIFILPLLFIVLLSLPTHSSSTNPTTVKLQLFWHHQFEFAGFYAAIEQGYFEKYNIKVELLDYEAMLDAKDVVLSGKAHFGLAGTDLIESYHKGKDVTLLASYFKQSPLTIITQPEISSLKQLTNKKVYGSKNQLNQGGIRGMLNLYDVDPEKFNLMMTGDPLELFKNKKVDAVFAFRTNFPYDLNQQNIPYKVFDPNQFGMISQDLNLFTTGSFAEKNPDIVKNFTLAANEGWRYAIAHPNEIINLIKSNYNIQHRSTEALEFEAQETIKLISPELSPVGSIQKNILTAISEQFFNNKVISKIKNVDDFVFQLNKDRIIEPKLFAALTKKEKNYLNEHPVIKVQNDGDYPPFNYQINGKPSGYSIDLINLMGSMLGIKVELVKGKGWVEYMAMLERKELDILINIIDIESRHDFAGFTTPYAEIATFAVSRTHEFSSIVSKEHLYDKRIAIAQGYAINVKLKKLLPKNQFISVKDTTEALNLISSNQADVYFEVGAVLDYYMAKNLIPNLQLVPVSSDFEVVNQKFSIAAHKDNETLLNILQKSINAIPDIEHIKLKRKWFGNKSENRTKQNSFTAEELQFISEASLILCRPTLNQGSDSVIQIIDLITRNVGLNIKMGTPLQWSESLKALENKKCDLILEVTKTEEREKTLSFTPNYFRDKLAIITKKNQSTIYDVFDHPNEKFGILKGSSSIELLKEHYPNIKLVEVGHTLEGIGLLKNDHIFGYISSLTFIENIFRNHHFENLKINTQLREKFDDHQSIATRKADKLLNSVLTKSINNTDPNVIAELIYLESKETDKIKLTPEEKVLLRNREIALCVAHDSLDWVSVMPYFLKSVDMKIIFSNKFTWAQALLALENGECDLLPEVTPTKKRMEIMGFTPSVHQEERVIVTVNEQKFINNIGDYSEQTFAVLKGDLLVEQLIDDYPFLKIEQVNSYLDGMQRVQNKNVFALIGSISIVGSVISKYGLKNLKISGSLPDKFNNNWTIATRKDDTALNDIFSKIVLSLDKKELRKRLFDDINVKYEQGFDYTLFWQMLFVALILLSAVVFWNRRLSTLNLQLISSKKIAEDAQEKVESQNRELLDTHQQLVQSEKMASLGTLTAGVAHEINNPTNFAHAAVYMMQKEIDEIKAFLKQLAGGDKADIAVISSFDSKFEKLIELTKTAKEGTQRIKVIVEDLRTFARLDDAKQAETKVSELIQSTVNLVKTQYENITISTDFDYDPLIDCFPSQLNQVFMNIIVNACQSIKTKLTENEIINADDNFEGMITICTSEQNNYLVININDNGGGMDELTQQKVCDPFFTTKSVGSGTGLGMAISFGIIEEHDGMLKISSTLMQGADFSIYLPVKSIQSDNKITIKE